MSCGKELIFTYNLDGLNCWPLLTAPEDYVGTSTDVAIFHC